MPVVNAEIAGELDKVADLLDIEGANPFRVRAYRRAARLVGSLPRNITDMLAAGEDLDDLPGIGEDLAEKIATIARGEHLPVLTDLEREVPAGITKLLAVPGLGPKRVHLLHEALGIDTIDKLAAAAKAGKLRGVPGFGSAAEAKLLRAIEATSALTNSLRLASVEQEVELLLRYLRKTEGVTQVEVAGSFRRRRETVGDLDIVAAAAPSEPVMRRFVGSEGVTEVVEQAPTRATVRLRTGLQVDLRVVAEASFGAALCYFTGSKAHNIALRRIAAAHQGRRGARYRHRRSACFREVAQGSQQRRARLSQAGTTRSGCDGVARDTVYRFMQLQHAAGGFHRTGGTRIIRGRADQPHPPYGLCRPRSPGSSTLAGECVFERIVVAVGLGFPGLRGVAPCATRQLGSIAWRRHRGAG